MGKVAHRSPRLSLWNEEEVPCLLARRRPDHLRHQRQPLGGNGITQLTLFAQLVSETCPQRVLAEPHHQAAMQPEDWRALNPAHLLPHHPLWLVSAEFAGAAAH